MCFLKKKVIIPEIPGAITSPVDNRDIALSSVQSQIPLTNLPENYTIPYHLRISNQGSLPHCVGYSCATIKEEKERREQTLIDFDGDWLYLEAKKIDGYNGDGTYPRVMMKILKEKGVKPLNELESEAGKYRIGGYARVDNLTVNGLKNAIYQNGAISALMRGSNDGWKNSYIKPPKDGEKVWGHEITLIGWEGDKIKFQNSWGQSWGDNGYGYFSKDYVPVEAWAILVDLPNDFIQIEKPKYNFTRDLQLGDRNEMVTQLQKCLKYLGMFPEVIDTTGYFGAITLQSIRLFQQTYNINPTSGYVGPLTRAKLNELFI